MAEVVTTDSYPEEYGRPPVYGRPPNASLVTAVERVTQGMTHTQAMREI